MNDPSLELTFEISNDGLWHPFFFSNIDKDVMPTDRQSQVLR